MKRFVNFVFVFTLFLMALWGIGLLRFAGNLSKIEDPSIRTDAIVVLTGGEGRLVTGLRLLEATPNSRLFVSGVSDGLTVDSLLRNLGEKDYPQDLRKRITFGYKARSTVQNAWETADWCEQEGINSIRLVTATYHMERSLLEFRPVMPAVRIVPYAVEPVSMQKTKWWQSPKSFLLIAREYTKFLIASMAHIFGLTTEEFRS